MFFSVDMWLTWSLTTKPRHEKSKLENIELAAILGEGINSSFFLKKDACHFYLVSLIPHSFTQNYLAWLDENIIQTFK